MLILLSQFIIRPCFSRSIKVVTTILVIFLFNNGCQKSSHEVARPENTTEETPRYASGNNGGNPFNYAGEYYITIQDQIANLEQFPDSLDKLLLYNTSRGYLENELDNTYFSPFDLTNLKHENLVEDTVQGKLAFAELSSAYFFNYLTSTSNISSRACLYLDSLKNQYSNFQDLSSLEAEINDLEYNVLQDSVLIAPNKQLLLGTLVTARKSLSYWHEVKNDPSHPWHPSLMEGITGNMDEFILNLSACGAVSYGVAFMDSYAIGYSMDESFSAGINQAAFSTGPVIIDTGEW